MADLLTTAAAAGGHEYATYHPYVHLLAQRSVPLPMWVTVRMTLRLALNSTGSVG